MDDAARTGLRIHLLGQPRFYYGGEPFAFRARPRALVLLVFLLMHRRAHLTRDLVAFTLWPDDSEAEARGKLRRHLHQLGSALPASAHPYVGSQEDVIWWNEDAGAWIDVDDFERCVADEARWTEAVDFYEGDLALSVYDDWIAPIRERVRGQYVDTLQRLLFRARSRRDFALATNYAERILANDQWREDVLRQLASIRYESGDRAGALRAIDAFARRLAAEMNVELMPETLALRALMLRGSALPDAAERRSVDTAFPASVFPFVGRSDELQQLAQAWRFRRARARQSRADRRRGRNRKDAAIQRTCVAGKHPRRTRSARDDVVSGTSAVPTARRGVAGCVAAFILARRAAHLAGCSCSSSSRKSRCSEPTFRPCRRSMRLASARVCWKV